MAEASAPLTKSQRLARLLEISRVLNSTHDLQPLLHSIVKVASELTQSETASILLYDHKSKQLKFEAAPGLDKESLRKLTVPLDSSVAGWVFKNRRPLVIHDAAKDSRIYRKVDRTLGFETRSILAVPLLILQRPIGVLESVNRRDQGHYTEDDLEILQALAAQASISIENARLLIKLRNANRELKRLDNMKSNFIAIASHELRTPLGLVLGHATFLREMLPDGFQEQLEVIVRSAMRLKNIIEDMASISHQEQGLARVRRAPFSLAALVADIRRRFDQEALEKEITLAVEIPPNHPLIVSGDREKIDLALANLVRNALTFTDPGGEVGIKVEGGGDSVKVLVADTGIGIPEAEVDRVFDRFYQVESHLTRRHGGMGLGLSIAKTMVEMHNGQIGCESKEGVGSVFWFVLPTNGHEASGISKVAKDH
ncbi:MAG: HAMP domain-containing sensor histidine kinase [Anaerolineales bacterium]|jgi:signal transduction histidine kinase